MTLEELIRIANEGYGDDHILLAFQGESIGDGLATFIAQEIADTFDPNSSNSKQVSEAIRVMEMALDDVNHVIDALSGIAIAELDDEDWQDDIDWEEVEDALDEPRCGECGHPEKECRCDWS